MSVRALEIQTGPNLALHEKLLALDTEANGAHYVATAVASWADLTQEERLVAIFYAWKTGDLHEIKKIDTESIIARFIECHELKRSGRFQDSFRILEELAQEVPASEIVQYRFTADSIDGLHLSDAMILIEKIMPKLRPWRRLALEFNYAIAANNTSQNVIVEKTLSKFGHQTDELSKLFYHWLYGAYESQRGDMQKSLEHYLLAVEIAQGIPSRSTDIAIIAFGALREAFWIGDLEHSRQMFNLIKTAAKERTSSVSTLRITLSTALTQFLEGNIVSAIKYFKSLYREKVWTYDHVQGSFVYLWALAAVGDGQTILSVIPELEKVRDRDGCSKEIFDFDLFKIYGRYLTGEITDQLAFDSAMTFFQDHNHSVQNFHLDWAQGLLLLFQTEPFEKIKSINHFKPYPLIQRTVVWALAKTTPGQLNMDTPIHWRYVTTQATDTVAQAMSQYRLSQLTMDSLGLVKSALRLHKLGALTWLQSMGSGESLSNYENAETIVNSQFVLDYYSHRIIATENLETLDQQPQLAELFLKLGGSEEAYDKEALVLALGFQNYDPLQHDPIIYNLLARLREWVKKQDLSTEIIRTPQGWKLGFFDRIAKIGEAPKPKIMSNLALAQVLPQAAVNSSVNSVTDLPERQQWIIQQLQTRKYITRADLLKQFPIKKSSAANDFNALIQVKRIVRFGSGRGIFYRLCKLDAQ